jgi:hypothetical protein
MNKEEIKKLIIKIILSSPELKNDYAILLNNSFGYMKNRIHEHYDRQKNNPRADTMKYLVANSEQNTRMVYANIISFKVKAELEKSLGAGIDLDVFRGIMPEVIDDLASGNQGFAV